MTWPTDHFDDLDAPPPTSVVQTASVIVEDAGGAILLRRRPDQGWALPGGAMEPGEEIQDAAVRRVRDETGIDVRLTGLVGIYPGDVVASDDGRIHEEFTVCFAATMTGDTPALGEASRDLALVTPDRLERYSLDPTARRCIADHLSHRGSSGWRGS